MYYVNYLKGHQTFLKTNYGMVIEVVISFVFVERQGWQFAYFLFRKKYFIAGLGLGVQKQRTRRREM